MSSLYSWPGSRRWVWRSIRPGHDPAVAHVDHPRVAGRRRRQARADALDPAVPKQHVRLRVEVARRIDHPAAAEADGGHEVAMEYGRRDTAVNEFPCTSVPPPTPLLVAGGQACAPLGHSPSDMARIRFLAPALSSCSAWRLRRAARRRHHRPRSPPPAQTSAAGGRRAPRHQGRLRRLQRQVGPPRPGRRRELPLQDQGRRQGVPGRGRLRGPVRGRRQGLRGGGEGAAPQGPLQGAAAPSTTTTFGCHRFVPKGASKRPPLPADDAAEQLCYD